MCFKQFYYSKNACDPIEYPLKDVYIEPACLTFIRKPLEELKITEEKVKKRLESLNQHKSPGPDGLHPRVLKELSNEISKPLAIIMQK